MIADIEQPFTLMGGTTVVSAMSSLQPKYTKNFWNGMPPSAGELCQFLGLQRIRVCFKRGKEFFGTWFWGTDSVDDVNKDGYDVYCIPNQVDPDFCGIKPADKDIVSSRWILGDYDLKTDVLTQSALDVGCEYVAGVIDAPLGIWTGNGFQRWYCYEAEHDQGLARHQAAFLLERLQDHIILKDVAGFFKVDSCTTDLSRLARWPNTINWKTGYRGAVLFNAAPDLARDRKQLGTIVPVKPAKVIGVEGANSLNLSALAPRLNAISSRFLIDGIDSSIESRHKAAYATAYCLKEIGLNYERARELVLAGATLCTRAGKPYPLPAGEAEHCARTAYKAGK